MKHLKKLKEGYIIKLKGKKGRWLVLDIYDEDTDFGHYDFSRVRYVKLRKISKIGILKKKVREYPLSCLEGFNSSAHMPQWHRV